MATENDMAFPVPPGVRTPNDTIQTGLTKREYFAAMAMQAIATSNENGGWISVIDAPEIAKRAFALADAMCSASDVPQKGTI